MEYITSGNIEFIMRGWGVDDRSENIYLTQCYEIASGINWLPISLGDIAFANQNSKTSQISGGRSTLWSTNSRWWDLH